MACRRRAEQVVFIGLLAVFEATVGVLVVSGGRRTQLGYMGVDRVLSRPVVVRGFELVWDIIMLPAMALLLRAERRAATAPEPARPGRGEATGALGS